MILPRGYREVQILGFRGFIREPWASSISIEDLLSEIGQPAGVVVKMRKSRAIKIREGLHVKEEFLRGWQSWPLMLKGLLNRGRLWRQWSTSLIAQERGIPTPEPRAYLEEREGLLPSRSLFVTQYESDCIALSQYLRGKSREGAWACLRGQDFLKELATGVRRMHEKGIVHHDLKGSNILVKEEGGVWSFRFTDLKASRFQDWDEAGKSIPMAERERDIIRLLASLRSFFGEAERRVFLYSYLSFTSEEGQRLIAKWEAESLKKFAPRQGLGNESE